MLKVVVYVVCHDEESRQEAEAVWAAFPWATVTVLPDTPATSKYMEGAAFLTVLPERRHEWQDADYVGVLSWRALEKIRVPPDFLDSLEEQHDANADVVALLPATEPLLAGALNSHARFLEVWVLLMTKLGFSLVESVSSPPLAFLCNYWLARPAWMDVYLPFYARMAHVLDTDSDESLQDALCSNSGYPTSLSPEQLERIYGTPHMQYHPFIGERVPCFFFWKMNARIATMPVGKWFGVWGNVPIELLERYEGREPGTFSDLVRFFQEKDSNFKNCFKIKQV